MSSQSPRSDVSLAALCERFGGEVVGDRSIVIDGVAPLDSASPRQLSFLSNPRYRPLLATTSAGAVLLSSSDAQAASASAGCAFWIHANPYAQFARVAQLFAAADAPIVAGIHASAVIEPGAHVEASASIGAHCVIGEGARIAEYAVLGAGCIVGRGVVIGASTRCYPRVTIYHDCVIGTRSILHSGVVIGADGFGFAPDGDAWVKIPQTGRVVIGDDVEIGANTTIDRGTMGDTRIGDGAKLDNQIQIGHNCDIGEGTVMAGCSAVAGSTKIGAHCMIGGAAMIIGHLTLCDKVTVSVGTVVSHSIHKPGFYTGFFPMQDNANWEKSAVLVRQLDKMRSRLKALEDQLKEQKGET